MTKAEVGALWRILTVLAGWDKIIAVEEIDTDLDVLLDAADKVNQPFGPFDDDDRDQMLESLRAQIDCNLNWHAFPRVEDVPGCDKAGIT